MKNNNKRKNMIKRRGKINIIILAICLIIISFIGQKCIAEKQIELRKITVTQYDTLWNIASDICDDNENLSIQNVIIEIKKINNLDNSNIYNGQQLFIPIY